MLTVASIVAFAASSRYVLAWVAIGLMGLLVVSFALTAREEHALRLKAEGDDEWDALLTRWIADGHTLLQLQDGFVFRAEHHAWHERIYSWLRDHRSLAEAQAFANVPSEPHNHRAWVAAQVEFLEGLLKRH